MPNDEDPPIRTLLAALFLAARIVRGPPESVADHEAMVPEALAFADQLIKQAGEL
jgi:hypothetical protein